MAGDVVTERAREAGCPRGPARTFEVGLRGVVALLARLAAAAGSACAPPSDAPTGHVEALRTREALRAHEVERLDAIESLPTASERERARDDLLEDLLRERLDEAGLLDQIERDPASSAALVEPFLAALRAELEALAAPDDTAARTRACVEHAREWTPTRADMDATEATLEVARREGCPEPESFGEYGIEAERARLAAREASEGGVR